METVESILTQTLQNFELIIINDGSTDTTGAILRGFTDARLRVLHNAQNTGLAYSLNRGLNTAQGKYLARIDAGDLAVPERLEKQVRFLEQHPEVGILGSGYTWINDAGQEYGSKRNPPRDLEIRWASLFKNPFFHPTVMLRRDVLSEHQLSYDPTFLAAQDYELWTRLLQHTHGANLDDLLLAYRQNQESITSAHRHLQLENHDIIALRTIQQQFPEFRISQEQVTQLRETFVGRLQPVQAPKRQQTVLTPLYLDLLQVFCQKYAEYPDIKALKAQETLRIALIGFRTPVFSSWWDILKRIVRLSPGTIFPLSQYIFKKHVLKRGKRFFGDFQRYHGK